jgi:uncharacterized membrane protein YGL010W
MSGLENWIEKYQRDHTHPMNRATHMVGIPMILVSLVVVWFAPAVGAGLFVVGWILQFIGHAFEGNAPSFMSDPRFLVVGAAWYLKKLGRVLGLVAKEPVNPS